MKQVTVYKDGKLCRGSDGKILKRRSNSVLISFIVDEYSEESGTWFPAKITRWFTRRRREKGGVYECNGWNYWYYTEDKL